MTQLPAHCTAIRGAVLTYTGDPFVEGIEATRRYESDALVVIADGRIVAFGPAGEMAPQLPVGTPVEQLPPHQLLSAGFIDTHVHYPQLPIIGAYGEQLLDWLNQYTFPAEAAYADVEHARAVARTYFSENLRNGITSAAVYGTVHPQSVDALLEVSEAHNLRTIAGKVLMDRHAPPELCDTAQSGYDDSKALIDRWHGRGRQLYAITPRFAPSCSPEQLEAAGALWRERPDCYVQSHLSENLAECDWVAQLFPQAANYLDVYDRFGLVGPRAVYGHGIHLSEGETVPLPRQPHRPGPLPHLQPVPGQRAVSHASGQARRPRATRGRGHGPGRGHQLLHAGDPQRGL